MVITLCGSARFENLFHEWNKKLTLSGHVVFSLAAFPSIEGDKFWYDDRQKGILDQIHKAKISHSDAIVVLNKHAYIGESTLSEIQWAKITGKEIFFLEQWGQNLGPGSQNESDEFLDEVFSKFGFYPKSPISTSSYAKPGLILRNI